ncbi:hypothetical protein HOK021_48080 [Streptomyces hygroscopicus]|nr:hypothetical protein HOK021_48080 [Streptomyces hygroscopicus]
MRWTEEAVAAGAGAASANSTAVTADSRAAVRARTARTGLPAEVVVPSVAGCVVLCVMGMTAM